MPPAPNLTPEERAQIERDYPAVHLDEEGYFISKAGKKTTGRILAGRAPNMSDPAWRAKGLQSIQKGLAERWDQYLVLIGNGHRQMAALEKTKIGWPTLKKRRDTDPDFVEAEIAARMKSVEKVVDAMFESALAGNFQAQNKILESFDPETWRHDKTIKVEQTNVLQIEPGENMMERIQLLMGRIAERRALTEGFIDVEATEPGE